MKLYGICGAGGFAREVMPVAREILGANNGGGSVDFELVFVVPSVEKDTVINGHRVISEAEFISYDNGDRLFNIAIAEYELRERIADQMVDFGVKPFSIIAPNSIIYDCNMLGDGAIVCSFTSITSNAKIGRFFHSNIYSYVAHDCVIGDFVTFAPNVHCNGKVVIEDYAYIGTGAVIKQGSDDRPIVIGKGCIVGMGAVVTKSIRPFTTVIGNPAIELKPR